MIYNMVKTRNLIIPLEEERDGRNLWGGLLKVGRAERTSKRCAFFERVEMVIFDNLNRKTMRLVGPCKISLWCSLRKATFKIFELVSDRQVGTITKEWAGWFKESCTNADNYSVMFEDKMDVNLKATIIAAAIYIDMTFFSHYPITSLRFLCPFCKLC